MAQYSYNGWEAHPDKNAINVKQHPVYSGGLKAGDVTTVLQYVADQLAARVEPVIPDHCWGYAWKTNANNASQLSCHASGTAIDFNAPAHPNGKSGTFTSAQVKTIEAILRECEGAVKWLKGYDEMHFEIGVNAQTLAGVAARLRGKPPASATPPPTTPTPPKDEDMPLNKDDLAAIEKIVNDRIIAHLGAAAVTNPNSVLNLGLAARLGADRRKDLGAGITVVKK